MSFASQIVEMVVLSLYCGCFLHVYMTYKNEFLSACFIVFFHLRGSLAKISRIKIEVCLLGSEKISRKYIVVIYSHFVFC